jgi:hydrogenase nickel incorporation protein HypA/HybF
MHELSLTRNIVAIVADAAKGRRVLRVTLEVGKLSGVMGDAIAFCFEVVAQGTVLEGATLRIVEVEGRALCDACGKEFATPTLYAACPCGSHRLSRLQGEELKIRTMELEEAA